MIYPYFLPHLLYEFICREWQISLMAAIAIVYTIAVVMMFRQRRIRITRGREAFLTRSLACVWVLMLAVVLCVHPSILLFIFEAFLLAAVGYMIFA